MEPLQLIGYFPKKVVLRPDWLKVPSVKAIRSVAACISGEPDDWVNKWLHNYEWFLFSSRLLALQVIPESERGDYEIHAYRILPICYDKGIAQEFKLPVIEVEPLPDDYVSIGFDAVSRSDSPMFEHSPLFCNHMASEFETNEHCLVDDLDLVRKAALQFSRGEVERGTYFVVEVLMQK